MLRAKRPAQRMSANDRPTCPAMSHARSRCRCWRLVVVFERGDERQACRAPCGREPAQHGGDDGQQQRVDEHAAVDRQIEIDGRRQIGEERAERSGRATRPARSRRRRRASARTRLSVSSCRINRPRLAPSASRTPISRRLAAPRPRRSPAILAQPTSRTSPATTVMTPTNAKSGPSIPVRPRNDATPLSANTSVAAKRGPSLGCCASTCCAVTCTAA